MTPNEAAKQIGTELGQSNPKGDARLAADLAAEPYSIYESEGRFHLIDGEGFVLDRDATRGVVEYHCTLLNDAYAAGYAAALAKATGGK